MSIGSLDQERDLLDQTGISGSLLTSMGLQKSIRYGSFLVRSGRLAKLRVRTRLEETDCIELVVVVDWDDNINNAIIAVDMDAGLD